MKTFTLEHRRKLSESAKRRGMPIEFIRKGTEAARIVNLGDGNIKWKGDKVGYRCLHLWVVRKLGKAQKCEHCGKEKTTSKSIQWANKSHSYLRDLTDWLQLCVSCHKKYDINHRKITCQ